MIVIPDVHGRSFWKDAIKGHENEEIIFLGDYLDPYPWEMIEDNDALNNFQEIIRLKENHPNNIILLLGNHDLHYFIQGLNGGRKMLQYSEQIRECFLNNKKIFQLAYEKRVGEKLFVFTHAGIRHGWINQNPSLNLKDGEGISDILNNTYNTESRYDLFKALGDVSMYRGGRSQYGSLVWADVDEHIEDTKKEQSLHFYQVFGHSQQEIDPIITSNFACLDCRKAFEIDNEGKITVINNETSNSKSN